MIVQAGETNVTVYFKLVDPVTGTPELGLVIANLDATYVRDRSLPVQANLVALGAVDAAHTDNRAIEVDGVNMPGLYRVDWPDAAFVAGVDRVQLCVNGVAIDPAYIEVELGAKLHTAQPGVTFTNNAGAALTLSSTGGNGAGLAISGNGTGAGIDVDAGATGVAMDIDAPGNMAIDIDGASGLVTRGAVDIRSSNGAGVYLEGPAIAMSLAGQLDITGGTTALQICSTGGAAVQIDGNGAGGHAIGMSSGNDAIEIVAGGRGVYLWSGAAGIDVDATTDGMTIDAAGGDGLRITGTVDDIQADITGNLSGSVGSVTGSVGGNVAGSVGSVVGLTNDTITDTVWAEPLPGAYAAGTAGYILGNIAATLTATLTASAAFLAAIAGAVWTWATRTLTSWAHLIGSVRTLATQAMHLQFCRGESMIVNVAIQYSGGGAFDLTGYEVYWALSQTRGGPALLTKSTVAGTITVISAPQGSITFTISVTESWALAAESYVHEIHIRQVAAPRAEHCALHGHVEVTDSTIGVIP